MKVSCLLRLVYTALSIKNGIAWKAEWVRLNPSQRITPRRSGLVTIGQSTPPLVFGGYAEDGNSPETYQRYVVNDLWQWQQDDDDDDTKWHKVATTGDMPAPRLVGTAAVLGDHNKAYLIGGWNSNAKDPTEMFLDTVHELDLPTMTWKKLPAVLPEGPASRHVAVALDGSTILVHTHRCIDHVWLWNGQEFTKQATKGPCPSPRGLHAACRVGNDRIVVFGGAAQDGTMSNQVFRLNTDTWTWQEIVTSNAGPTPRASPCICTLDDSHVLVYGGAEALDGGLHPHGDVWMLDLNTCEWTCLVSSNHADAPPPRNGAALLPLTRDDSVSEYLLTGGWAPFVETWDDCHILKVTPQNS